MVLRTDFADLLQAPKIQALWSGVRWRWRGVGRNEEKEWIQQEEETKKKGSMRMKKGKGESQREMKGKEKAEVLTGCSLVHTKFEFSNSSVTSLHNHNTIKTRVATISCDVLGTLYLFFIKILYNPAR